MPQQETSEASVASSSPVPNWWDPTNPFPSWTHPSVRWAPEDGGVSADLSDEPPDSQLWSQVLLNIGSSGDLSGSNNGENFVDVLSSKTLASTDLIYNDPACDYLKKMDGGWGFTNRTSLNSFHKQLISDYNSDLVSNWSIAPPTSQAVDRTIGASTCFIAPSMDRYPPSDPLHVKHEFTNMPLYTTVESESSIDHGIGYQIGLNNSVLGLNRVFEHNLNISFNGCLSKPSPGFRPSKLVFKGPDSLEGKRQVYESSSSTRGSGRTSEGKKKRSEDSSDTNLKKAKLDRSTVSSLKLQAPKMKLADKITALQQIVSPFGKTDTASVLLEAIKYIGFLQEQVQLLSDPYMKSSARKDHNSWGLMERKEKADAKVDLRSRGLCLVPISSTPQIYREMSGPDYWTPTTYRGCLYR